MANTEVGFKLSVSGEQQVRAAFGGVESQVERLTGAVSRVSNYGAAFLAITQGVVPLAQAAIRAADAVTTLNNQLVLATGSAQAANAAYRELFDIAQRSRVSFTDLGGTFASISRAGQELGLSQQRLLKVTEAIGNAMTVSGGSAQGMNAALTQLGQGLASGTLRGEELNSVMEQAPRLAKALADGLGVPIGKLREMGAAGQISAEQVIRALESQSAVLRGEVTGAVLTVGQAMTQLQNATILSIGDLDKATGASSSLAEALSWVASGIGAIGQAARENEVAVKTVFGAVAGAGVAAGLLAVGSRLTRVAAAIGSVGAALVANPAVAAVLGVGAAVTAGASYVSARSRTPEGMREAIATLEEQNRMSEVKLQRAIDGGRAAGAANIQSVMEDRRRQIRGLVAELALLDSANLDTRAEDARLAATVQNTKAVEKDRDAYAKLARELSGFKGNYQEYNDSIALIERLQARGTITSQEAAKQLQELAKKHGLAAKETKGTQDAERELAKQRQAAWKIGELRNRQVEEQFKFEAQLAAQQAATVAREYEQADSIHAQAQAREFANDKTVDAALAMQRLTLAQLEQQRADLEATDNVIPGYIQALDAKIAAQKRLISATQAGIEREETDKRAREAEEAWRRAASKIEDALTDALMRGFESGKDFARNLRDTVVNMFKTLVLRPVISAIINPVAGVITGALGFGGASAAAAGQAGGSSLATAGGLSNLYSMGKAAYSGFQNIGSLGSGAIGYVGSGMSSLGSLFGSQSMVGYGAGLQYGQMAAGQYASLAQSGVVSQSSAAAAASGANMASTVGPYANALGAALVAYMAGKMISGGYSAIGKTGNTAVVAGTAIGAAIGGPIGAVIGGTIGGLVNRAFGMGPKKITSQGITGTFGESGANVQTYTDWYRKGGWFRSSRRGTNYGSIDASVDSSLDASIQSVFAANRAFASAVGLSADAVNGYTQSIRISLSGLDAAGQEKALSDAIQRFGADMVSSAYGQALAQYQQGTETAADALARLANSLTSVNKIFDALGQKAYSASLATAAMADDLIRIFGSLDVMASKTEAYYQAFYTEGERSANATRQLTQAFASIGMSLPATREQFRQLVEAQDLSTVAGRQTYAALINVSGALDQVLPKFDTLAGKFGQLAATMADQVLVVLDEQMARNALAARQSEESARSYRAAAVDMRASIEALYGTAAGPQAGQSALRAKFNAAIAGAQAGNLDSMATASQLSGSLAESLRGTARTRAEYTIQAAMLQAQLAQAAEAADQYAELADYQKRLYDINAAVLNVLRDSLVSGNATVEQLAVIDRTLERLGTLISQSGGMTIEQLQAVDQTTGLVAEATGGNELLSESILRQLQTPDAGSKFLSEIIATSNDYLAGRVDGVIAAINQQTAAQQAELKRQQDLQKAQEKLSTIASARNLAIGQVEQGIQRIWELASAYGVYLNSNAGPLQYANTAVFDVNDQGLFTSQYGQISSKDYRRLAPFKSAFYAAGGVYEQTYGRAGELQQLASDLEAQRKVIRDLGGIPAFAAGGLHAGGIRLVGERGPELEVTGPSRIFNAAQTARMLSGGDAGRLAVLLEALTREVSELRVEARATAAATNKTARILDRVTPDGSSLQTVAAA
ncbi:MAG: hypothetical protein RL758_349 [Pseudomonadota bacterium]|jgi:tape measure domain-containing protein